MPLFYIQGNGKIERVVAVPHQGHNQPIINRIPNREFLAIKDEINRLVDLVVDSPHELITAGWLPGNDWTGTVWEPIYIAANLNFDLSGMIFGAIVFQVMMERDEDWSLGKYQIDGRDIGSNTYFRIYPR
ncbi:MAG: hypothetical protein LBS60_07215 [Deltaproteobacteria bacterium]|jgi:hypothetical protein|nr:hypothetical protein [Deltaproteobacteria bacterium]